MKIKKIEIKKRCQEILKSENISNDDNNFLLDLFKNHHSWVQKEGCGISKIEIRKTLYGNKCFWLIRKDKTETDISYLQCLNPDNKLKKIQLACRNSIRDIVVNFRNNNLIENITTCPFTNVKLNSKNTHVDHYDKTFIELFNEWIKDKNIDILYESINKNSDGEVEVYFIDNDIKNNFINYHNNNTNLRLVSDYANTSILKNRKK